MTNLPPPTFDEWVAYCLLRKCAAPPGTPPDAPISLEDREARFTGIDPPLMTTYLTQLFEAPSFIAEEYSDYQIAEAVSFLFGMGSGYIHGICNTGVPPELQIRCIRSISTFYTDLLDRVCGDRGSDPDSDLIDESDVDGEVYMIWDVGGLEYIVTCPDRHPHLVEPAIEILENVLRRCRTSACRISALHGIGHILCDRQGEGDASKVARLRAMVDEFTDRPDVPDWLHRYAFDARSGMVQ